MNTEIVINKVVITAEAACDYRELKGAALFKRDFKYECETYIDNMISVGRLDNYYFRCKYYDEETDEMLMLFFYKGERFGSMQMWNLKGVCLESDFSEEMEKNGQIRVWLNSELHPEDKSDWVVELRERERRKESGMPTYSLAGLPKEVINAIYSGTDQDAFERLSCIKRKGGKWVGIRKFMPSRKPTRKVCKRLV